MMHSSFESFVPEALPPLCSCEGLVDNTYNNHADTQRALSQVTRRLSRGSSGQRSSTTMRVSKPNSASNSPGGSSKMTRRRTMVNDAQSVRRQQQAVEYYVSSTQPAHVMEPALPKRQTRPLSWHPSSQLQTHLPQFYAEQQQQQRQQEHQQDQLQTETLAFSTPNSNCDQSEFYPTAPQYSPLMTTYSNDASPSPSFSSLPVPYQCVDSTIHTTADDWHFNERSTLFPLLSHGGQFLGESCGTLNGFVDDKAPTSTALDWNTFIMHGYSTTSPPTPDSFVQRNTTQLPQPTVSESNIHDLDEGEEESEVLVGMGLYDDKGDEDPHLNNYRSTVTSLLGSAFRPQEPRGKGLKLEETWEPPKSDDEEEEEEEEEDGFDE